MKSQKFLIIGMALIAIAVMTMPYFASADHAALNQNVFDITTLKSPLLICVGAPNGANQPVCSNLCDFVAQIAQIIYFMIALIIWIVAPVMVAIGGVLYMLAGASPEKIGTAKKMLTSVAWGLAITLCAWLIVYTFVNAFGNLSKFVGGFGGANQAACTITGGTGSGPNNPCNSGEVYDPTTGECSGSSSSNSNPTAPTNNGPCNAGEVFDPTTGECSGG